MRRIYRFSLALVFASTVLFLAPPSLTVPACLLATSPLLYFTYKALKLSILHSFTLYTVWTLYMCAIFSPLFLLIGKVAVLVVYIPLLLVFKDIKHEASPLFLICQTLFWDTPLILFMRIMAYIGVRALEPFYSEINDKLIVGSLPFEHDVVILSKLKVGAVINMCREYSGPLAKYAEFGIQQYRVPTPDLCQPPDLAAIIRACEFMKNFGEKNPSQRIFVHCKGGRARAAVMSLCYLMYMKKSISEEVDIAKELDNLVAKRSVTSRAVLKYPVLIAFREYLLKFKGK